MVVITRFNKSEIQILTLLNKHAVHVRALRRELNDNGSISTYLKHLQELGLIKQEERKLRIVNMLTPKGKRVAKAVNTLKFS